MTEAEVQENPVQAYSLPLYASHKIVAAAKITGIESHRDMSGLGNHSWDLLTDEATGTDRINVSHAYMTKHTPHVGGYYVRYQDGYESYSPPGAFEGGYTRLTVHHQALFTMFDHAELGGRVTIRDYLHALLLTLWVEGEGFSGKRPFGDSGWEDDLYRPLVAAGFIKGAIEDGDVEVFNLPDARAFVAEMIRQAFVK